MWLLILFFFFLRGGQSELVVMLSVKVGEHLIERGNECFAVQFFKSVIL